jgi:RNA polymerase sigma-70 factor (ECF subfamily)
MTQPGALESDEIPCESPLTSLTLLERVKKWDPGAWQRLVDVYAPLVYRWCRRTGVKADDTPDVLQEVFCAVATHIETFHRDRSGDSFRGWLWTVTRHKICDHARRRNRQPKALGGSSANARLCQIPNRLPSVPEEDPICPDDAILARRVVELIRPEVENRTWRAFWRLAVDGQAGPDVASELGMSLQAVHQAKYRVLRLIRQEMDCLQHF